MRPGAAAGLDLRLDQPALVDGKIADLEERIDEEAEPELGRQAPGGGVRRVDEAELLEVGHDVADRGWRKGARQQPRDVARADRLAGLEVLVDDALEDFARAPVEPLQGRALLAGLLDGGFVLHG